MNTYVTHLFISDHLCNFLLNASVSLPFWNNYFSCSGKSNKLTYSLISIAASQFCFLKVSSLCELHCVICISLLLYMLNVSAPWKLGLNCCQICLFVFLTLVASTTSCKTVMLLITTWFYYGIKCITAVRFANCV